MKFSIRSLPTHRHARWVARVYVQLEIDLRTEVLEDGYYQSQALERLLSDDFEADQSDIDALESEDSDAGGVEIQGYLPEALQSLNELYPSSSVG